MNCPSCGSLKFWNNGFNRRINEQCFKCKACGKQFYPKMFDPMKKMRTSKKVILLSLRLYFHHNLSSRQIARILEKNKINRSHTSVSLWIKKFGTNFMKNASEPAYQLDNKRLLSQLTEEEGAQNMKPYLNTESFENY